MSIRTTRFTLVELLTAIAILLMITTALIYIVGGMNKISVKQRAKSEIYEQQRLLFDLIERDLKALYVSDSSPGVPCWFSNSSTGYQAKIITSSAIGLSDSADSSTLMEIGYSHDDSGDRIYRAYSASGDFSSVNAEWNFLSATDTQSSTWLPSSGSSVTDSTVVAESVRAFTMRAYNALGNQITADTTAVPAMVIVELEMYDQRMTDAGVANADKERNMIKFSRKIYLNRGL